MKQGEYYAPLSASASRLLPSKDYVRHFLGQGWHHYDKLMAVPTARVARTLAPLTFSTGHQLVGGVAPKPPSSPCTVPIHLSVPLHNSYHSSIPLHSSIHSFVPLYSSIYSPILLHSPILPFILLSSFIVPPILLYSVTIRLICDGKTNKVLFLHWN